ncbi:MAG: DUF4255 domain-containing protein [Salinivenus sp.]
MATFRAIETISTVLVDLLRASHEAADLENAQFEIYQSEDFRSQGGNGGKALVTLFLYRTKVNGSIRTPPGRRRPNGETQRTQLPLDLHYLITIWAGDPSTQHQLAGWIMRTLETTPILPKGVLNGVNSGVFRPDETVEIILNDLSDEELFRIWDLLGEPYRLSIPYLVRNVRVESGETVSAEGVVERRIFDYLQHGAENGEGDARGG